MLHHVSIVQNVSIISLGIAAVFQVEMQTKWN